MIWFIYAPLIFFLKIFCYLTNPVVVLFSNSVGQLPGILKYWQTWDSTLDNKQMMTEIVPDKYKWLDYHWNEKYELYEEYNLELNRTIEKVKLKQGVIFSFKEKIQQYFCRLLWIYRNCAYGFAMYLLGTKGRQDNMIYPRFKTDEKDEFVFGYDKTRNILVRPWTCRFYKRIIGSFYLTGYLGWKIPWWNINDYYQAMIANRIAPRFEH